MIVPFPKGVIGAGLLPKPPLSPNTNLLPQAVGLAEFGRGIFGAEFPNDQLSPGILLFPADAGLTPFQTKVI